MSQALAIQAVRDRFIAQVATPNALAVVYDNGPVPATVTPRAAVTINVEDERQRTFGQRSFRITGRLQVELAVPRERGDAALLDLANDVLVAFRGKTATTPIPVRFTPPPTLVGGVDYDDAMARRTVSVPFLCDFTA
jgi:hypothetical protein